MSRNSIRGDDLQKYADTFRKVSWIECSNIPTGFAYGRLSGEIFGVGEGGAWRGFGATSLAVMLRMLTETLLVEKLVREDIDSLREKYVPEIYRMGDLMERESGTSFSPHPLYLKQEPNEEDFLYLYMATTPEEMKSLNTMIGLEAAEDRGNVRALHGVLNLALTGVYAAKVAVEKGLGAAILEGVSAFVYGPAVALGIESAKSKKGGSRGG